MRRRTACWRWRRGASGGIRPTWATQPSGPLVQETQETPEKPKALSGEMGMPPVNSHIKRGMFMGLYCPSIPVALSVLYSRLQVPPAVRPCSPHRESPYQARQNRDHSVACIEAPFRLAESDTTVASGSWSRSGSRHVRFSRDSRPARRGSHRPSEVLELEPDQ